MFEGNYFNGKTARPYPSIIYLKEDGINIQVSATGESLLWKYSEINKFQRQNSGTTFYFGKEIPYSTLLVKDPSFLETLESKVPDAPFLVNVHRKFEKKGNWAYLAALLATIAFLLVVNFILLPYAINTASKNVPISIEQEWGDEFFITFKQFNDIDSLGSILLTEFAEELNLKSTHQLRFYVVKSKIANAFALPGGRIVVFTGIINKMQNYEELAALLGHEVGHVENRHALKNIFNEYSHSYLLKLLLGNGSEILGSIGQSASQLSLLSNSRKAEKDADAFGLNILQNKNIDPHGMINLFKALQSEEKNQENSVMEMISTHPNIEKRILMMQQSINETDFIKEEHPKMELTFIQLKKSAGDTINKSMSPKK